MVYPGRLCRVPTAVRGEGVREKTNPLRGLQMNSRGLSPITLCSLDSKARGEKVMLLPRRGNRAQPYASTPRPLRPLALTLGGGVGPAPRVVAPLGGTLECDAARSGDQQLGSGERRRCGRPVPWRKSLRPPTQRNARHHIIRWKEFYDMEARSAGPSHR